MDSNLDDSAEQLSWFNGVIESEAFKTARYRIVSIHIPPYIEYWDKVAWEQKGESRWNQKVREKYAPLFERHGVNLVLSGHQHNYQRGTRNQVLYVICGGAGGNLDQEMVVNYGFYEKTIVNHHYLILNIGEKALTGKVYNFNNRKVDEWRINPN